MQILKITSTLMVLLGVCASARAEVANDVLQRMSETKISSLSFGMLRLKLELTEDITRWSAMYPDARSFGIYTSYHDGTILIVVRDYSITESGNIANQCEWLFGQVQAMVRQQQAVNVYSDLAMAFNTQYLDGVEVFSADELAQIDAHMLLRFIGAQGSCEGQTVGSSYSISKY